MTRTEEIQKKMIEIEKEFKGFSNIPLKHEYWGLRKELGVINSK